MPGDAIYKGWGRSAASRLLLRILFVTLIVAPSSLFSELPIVAQAAPEASVALFLDARQGLPGADTGIDLAAGQQANISATGMAGYGTESASGCSGSPQTDPGGQRYLNGAVCGPKIDPNAVDPNHPIGFLLARIGNVTWTGIGSIAGLSSNAGGRLYLLYNDDNGYWADNSGGYNVTISLGAPPAPPASQPSGPPNVGLSSQQIGTCKWNVTVSVSGMTPNSPIQLAASGTRHACGSTNVDTFSWGPNNWGTTDSNGTFITVIVHEDWGNYTYTATDGTGRSANSTMSYPDSSPGTATSSNGGQSQTASGNTGTSGAGPTYPSSPPAVVERTIPPATTAVQKGQIVGLAKGTQIRTGPGLSYPSTIPAQWGSAVPTDDWQVLITGGPVCADGWLWWNVDRKAAGDPNGGTGWAAIRADPACGTSPSQPQMDGTVQRTQMVQQLYRDILGRDADSQGLNNYVNSGLSEQDIRNSLLASSECHQGLHGECQSLYGQQASATASFQLGLGIEKWYMTGPAIRGLMGNIRSGEFDASPSPYGTAGRVARFDNGSIYWSPRYGTHEVYGGINDVFERAGGTGGSLGFPKTGVYDDRGAKREDFEGGYITWFLDGYTAFSYQMLSKQALRFLRPPEAEPSAQLTQEALNNLPSAQEQLEQIRSAFELGKDGWDVVKCGVPLVAIVPELGAPVVGEAAAYVELTNAVLNPACQDLSVRVIQAVTGQAIGPISPFAP